MKLNEIKLITEAAGHYPDIKITMDPDRGYIVVDSNTYDDAHDGYGAIGIDHNLEAALSELEDQLLQQGSYDVASIRDAIHTAMTVHRRESDAGSY